MSETGFRVGFASGVETAEEFRIAEERPAASNVTVLVLHGEVDLHAAPELRERLREVVEEGADHVVVDLSSVSFVDSMALGVLLGAHKQLQAAGGELGLVVPGTKLRRIFEITLLDQVFTLARTRQEALGADTSAWGG